MTFSTLTDLLVDQAKNHGHRPAITCAGRTWTYQELQWHSDRIAAGLAQHGVEAGDRVAFMGQESVEYYATVFACARLAAVIVPVNFRLRAAETAHIITDSTANIVLADEALHDLLRTACPEANVLGTSPDSIAAWAPAGASVPAVRCTPNTPVVQMYTSGTTGLPKGVVLAHRSFFAVRNALRELPNPPMTWTRDDVNFIGIPGSHVGGIWWAAQGFSAAAHNIAMPAFDAADALGLIEHHRVTSLCVVPSMLAVMLLLEPSHGSRFRSVRQVVYGGSPICPDLLCQAQEAFQARFTQIYGLTETGNTAVCLPPEQHYGDQPRLLAAGIPYPGFEARVVLPNGNQASIGEVGEIWLRTPAAMVEYWRNPQATSETLIDGWIVTGDAGYLDCDGYVYVCDRIKDMIIVAGENVYPAEIEKVLTSHPQIADAAVVGTPDPTLGERVTAHVVRTSGSNITAQEVITHCRKELATFKVPSDCHFTSSIPRNPSGKVLRRQLATN